MNVAQGVIGNGNGESGGAYAAVRIYQRVGNGSERVDIIIADRFVVVPGESCERIKAEILGVPLSRISRERDFQAPVKI